MYKIIAIIALIFAILPLFYFIVFRIPRNNAFDRELNEAVISLVNQTVTVKFRTHCMETLEDIMTKELLERLENLYSDFFRDERFYFVNRNFMRTLTWFETGSHWGIQVGIYEGIFFDRSYFIEMHIIQNADKTYEISFIGKDA